jgi:hypothetical protein
MPAPVVPDVPAAPRAVAAARRIACLKGTVG